MAIKPAADERAKAVMPLGGEGEKERGQKKKVPNSAKQSRGYRAKHSSQKKRMQYAMDE